jgi:hypothetical protein
MPLGTRLSFSAKSDPAVQPGSRPRSARRLYCCMRPPPTLAGAGGATFRAMDWPRQPCGIGRQKRIRRRRGRAGGAGGLKWQSLSRALETRPHERVRRTSPLRGRTRTTARLGRGGDAFARTNATGAAQSKTNKSEDVNIPFLHDLPCTMARRGRGRLAIGQCLRRKAEPVKKPSDGSRRQDANGRQSRVAPKGRTTSIGRRLIGDAPQAARRRGSMALATIASPVFGSAAALRRAPSSAARPASSFSAVAKTATPARPRALAR